MNSPKPRPKTFLTYLPLCVTVLIIISPHPSFLLVIVNYHLRTLHAPFAFATHLLIVYALTFLTFSSLIVCVSRDPGPVTQAGSRAVDDDQEIELTQALMFDQSDSDDESASGSYCFRCDAPKPERTHHCQQCGRCVLKMDHHCPWLGSKCIGYRTYPAFLHFLLSATLLSTYIAAVAISALVFAFHNPLSIDSYMPIHGISIAFAGITFALVLGSFLCYHLYLVTTNQTTLENITHFLLLRYLPTLPPSPTGQKLSNPPLEHELTFSQRLLVRDAHDLIRPYDVGWRENWRQVFGWEGKPDWVARLWWGGDSRGDGRTYPRNPRVEEMLARLAVDLVTVDA